jgi:hypothetical protein
VKTDQELQQDVMTELKWEPGICCAADIGVAAKDGVVTLGGTVDSYSEKWAAEKAAGRVWVLRQSLKRSKSGYLPGINVQMRTLPKRH